ncbi:unnamed protein product, partial [Allacma fusca]
LRLETYEERTGLYLIFRALLLFRLTEDKMNEPEKIIEWRSDGNSAPQMHLHRDVLQSVLSQTAGKKLRVVSIVGPFRTGKSFLMSLIVRYLEYLEKEPG